MGEEEHEGLKDFREHVNLETRHRIGLAFAAFEAEHVTGVKVDGQRPRAATSPTTAERLGRRHARAAGCAT